MLECCVFPFFYSFIFMIKNKRMKVKEVAKLIEDVCQERIVNFVVSIYVLWLEVSFQISDSFSIILFCLLS